ncbi:shiE [Escherichia coli]|nr:shiE [Escherichia coli]
MTTLRKSKIKLKKGFKIARLNIKMKLINYLHWVLILMIIKIVQFF